MVETIRKNPLQEMDRRARIFENSPEGRIQKVVLDQRREEVKRYTLKPSDIGTWETYEIDNMYVLVPGKYNDRQRSIAFGFSYNLSDGVMPVWSTDKRIRGLMEKTKYLGPVLISEHEDLLREIMITPPPRQGKK